MAESEYLRQTVGEPLAKCLTDVVLHRPNDPIEFIALWLYKHSANVQHELQLAKEAEQLAKEIEDDKIAKELIVQLALEEEQQHQKEKEQVAKQLEEAERLQVHHADNSADKHGPVPAVRSVPSAQHAILPEDNNEQEEEEAASRVPSHISQNVGSESEVDLQTEMLKSEESEIERHV